MQRSLSFHAPMIRETGVQRGAVAVSAQFSVRVPAYHAAAGRFEPGDMNDLALGLHAEMCERLVIGDARKEDKREDECRDHGSDTAHFADRIRIVHCKKRH